MFKAKHNQSEQVINFTTVGDITKAHVRTECDPCVVRYLEKEVETGPNEPTAAKKEDGTMVKTDKMKRKSKYDK